jgi:hypothetical protein
MIKKVKDGFQLHSKTTGKPIGPVRKSQEDVSTKDEKRVQFFRNLKSSSKGPASLKAKARKAKPALVKKVKGK